MRRKYRYAMHIFAGTGTCPGYSLVKRLRKTSQANSSHSNSSRLFSLVEFHKMHTKMQPGAAYCWLVDTQNTIQSMKEVVHLRLY